MKRGKILVVDDSNTVILTASLLLGDYELVTARDGEEGVVKAMRERPDLILLDLVMPKLDGFEVCRRLRQHGDTASTPILMMTTRGEPHHITAGYESGCSEYITKPFDGSELLAKIRSFLGEP